MFNVRYSETFITLPQDLTPCIIDSSDLFSQIQLASTCTFFYNGIKSRWQQLITLGCSREVIKEFFNIVKENPQIIINFKTLCNNIVRLAHDDAIYDKSFLVSTYSLFSLTGELSGSIMAIKLINATSEERDAIYEEKFWVALTYTACTRNVDGLKLIYNQIMEYKKPKNELYVYPSVKANIFINAINSNHLPTLNWVINTFKIEPHTIEMQENMLICAAKVGYVDMMKYAIANKIDKQSVSGISGLNALQVAALSGKLQAAKYAMELGLSQNHRENCNLLHFAFQSGDPDTIQYFLDLKIDPLALTTDGTNILHYAAMHGHINAMRLACSLGITCDTPNEAGLTALHFGAKAGLLASVQCALALGIDLKMYAKEVLYLSAASGNLVLLEYITSLMTYSEVRVIFKEDTRIIRNIIKKGMGVPGLQLAQKFGLDLSAVRLENDENLLHIAIARYHPSTAAVLTYLVEEAKVEPQVNANKETILHKSFKSCDLDIMVLAYQILKAQYPDNDPVEAQDEEGNTICGLLGNHRSITRFLNKINGTIEEEVNWGFVPE